MRSGPALGAFAALLLTAPPVLAQATSASTATTDTQSSSDWLPDWLPGRADLSGLRVWQTFYAGKSSLAGDAIQGTQAVRASILGTTFGIDKQIDDQTLIGVSLGLSRQTFSSSSGNGRSDDAVLTLYGRRTFFDQAYLALALGYGWHDLLTARPITTFGNLSLDASYHATDWGGRLETGYTFALDGTSSAAPFFALVGDSYHQPGYSETLFNTVSSLGASYAAMTTAVTHTELGLRYYRYFSLDDGWYLSLDTAAAWERELDDDPLILASFQTSPGSSFVLRGTRPAEDTALLGTGLRLQVKDGFTFGIRSDARLGAGTTIFSGTLDATYRW